MVSEKLRIAYLGLGAMGFAMSTHLVRDGVHVIGFDIWKPTLEKFEAACKQIPDASFEIATSPSEAVKSASVVVIMVATHHHINSALFEGEAVAAKSMQQDSTIIITSTVPPTYPSELKERLTDEYGRDDIKLIDAPVSGGTIRSADGTLTVMASSNDPTAFEDLVVRQILHKVASNGKTLFQIPGTLGAGTSTKALNQVQCGVHIVSGSEIMALAAINRLNTQHFYERMKSVAVEDDGKPRYGWTWMFENRGPRMLDPALPISSAVSIINKDVGIIKDEETRLSITLPIINQVHLQLAKVMEAGLASVDDAWINRYYLGLKTSREMLVVEQTTATATATATTDIESQDSRADLLLLAHAVINFQSAYETFLFAEALDLLGEAQRQMWFTVIAGAAGASRVFSEVVPLAFDSLASTGDWKAGFKNYAADLFGDRFGTSIPELDKLVLTAKEAGVQPILLETAMSSLKHQLY